MQKVTRARHVQWLVQEAAPMVQLAPVPGSAQNAHASACAIHRWSMVELGFALPCASSAKLIGRSQYVVLRPRLSARSVTSLGHSLRGPRTTENLTEQQPHKKKR